MSKIDQKVSQLAMLLHYQFIHTDILGYGFFYVRESYVFLVAMGDKYRTRTAEDLMLEAFQLRGIAAEGHRS